MLISEIAQKNARLKSWKEILESEKLSQDDRLLLSGYLEQYKGLVAGLISSNSDSFALVPTESELKLSNLERKITQLAESSRLEFSR